VLDDDATQHVSIYPYVLVFCTLDDLECCLFSDKNIQEGDFLFSYVHDKVDIGMLIVEEN